MFSDSASLVSFNSAADQQNLLKATIRPHTVYPDQKPLRRAAICKEVAKMLGITADLSKIRDHSRHLTLAYEGPKFRFLDHSFPEEAQRKPATTDVMPSEIAPFIVGKDFVPETQGKPA